MRVIYSGGAMLLCGIALVLAILCMAFIVPRSRKPYLNNFFKWLHHVFNFDSLLIESILKFLYIFSTFAVIFLSILVIIEGGRYSNDIVLIGLACMLLGPFVIRLFYEAMMMMVILVKHVVEINRKVKDENPGRKDEDPFAPAEPPVRAPRPVAPTCPSCGSRMRPGAKFCGVCGYRAESAPAPAEQPASNNYYPTDNDL